MKKIYLPKIFQPFACLDLIRVGKNNDGGYLLNKNDIIKSQNLISLGIGEDWSFEEQFLSMNDCSLSAYDKSVSDNDFFSGKRKLIRKNINSEISFEDVISLSSPNSFLKCDIEGDEYDILFDIVKHDEKLSGLVIEFHDLQKQENFNELTNFISKVGLKLVHIHINNYTYFKIGYGIDQKYSPSVIELSFSSSDNVTISRDIKLPNHLDMSNNPNDDEFEIIF